jgi:hypothetical protein
MGSLSNIVTVNVSTLTSAVKQAGFGVPLIVDYNTRFLERIRYYTSQAGMISDGFTVNDAAYKAAGAILAQTPNVARFAIGRRATIPDQQVDLTASVGHLTTYAVDVIGPAGVSGSATFTSDATATLAEIHAGLIAAINALAAGVTATDLTTFIRVKAAVAGQWFSVTVRDATKLSAAQTHVDAGIAADLAAIAAEPGADFYGVTMTTQGRAEITAAAVWVESNKKIAIFGTQDVDVISTGLGTDIASTLKTANEFRSIAAYHPSPSAFIGAAWLGATLALDPGSLTFKFRKLASVPLTTLTETNLANLRAKNAGWFTDYGGVGITAEGTTAAGEFADVIRDRDFLESRLQTDTFSVLANNPKVPFTDAGIAMIEGVIRARLLSAVSAGILADSPAPAVIVPLASAVAGADRTARKLKPITFTARLAGAIHAIDITGTVTV